MHISGYAFPCCFGSKQPGEQTSTFLVMLSDSPKDRDRQGGIVGRERRGESGRQGVVCLLVAQRPSNRPVNLRDGFAQTIVHAATLR